MLFAVNGVTLYLTQGAAAIGVRAGPSDSISLQRIFVWGADDRGLCVGGLAAIGLRSAPNPVRTLPLRNRRRRDRGQALRRPVPRFIALRLHCMRASRRICRYPAYAACERQRSDDGRAPPFAGHRGGGHGRHAADGRSRVRTAPCSACWLSPCCKTAWMSRTSTRFCRTWSWSRRDHRRGRQYGS